MWIIKAIKNHLYKDNDRDRKVEQLRDIASKIKEYYLDKSINNETAKSEIFSLGITRLELKNNVLTITLQRPGVLIGSKGSNIEALQKYLNLTIEVKEELVIPYLYYY